MDYHHQPCPSRRYQAGNGRPSAGRLVVVVVVEPIEHTTKHTSSSSSSGHGKLWAAVASDGLALILVLAHGTRPYFTSQHIYKDKPEVVVVVPRRRRSGSTGGGGYDEMMEAGLLSSPSP